MNHPAVPAPSSSPSAAPTEHPCTDGTHNCSKTVHGICYAGHSNHHWCGCVSGFVCVPTCNDTEHTCQNITESPTASPTHAPFQALSRRPWMSYYLCILFVFQTFMLPPNPRR